MSIQNYRIQKFITANSHNVINANLSNLDKETKDKGDKNNMLNFIQ